MAQLMPLPLTVSCFSKIQIGLTFLVPAHLGSPGKRAVKRVCVCMQETELQPAVFPVSGQFRFVWLDTANVVRCALHQRINKLVCLSLHSININRSITCLCCLLTVKSHMLSVCPTHLQSIANDGLVIIITRCCSIKNERLHHWSHLPNNIGPRWIFLIFHNGLEDASELSLPLGGSGSPGLIRGSLGQPECTCEMASQLVRPF